MRYTLTYARLDENYGVNRTDIETCGIDDRHCTLRKEAKFEPETNHACYYDRDLPDKIHWSDYTTDPRGAYIAAWFFFSSAILILVVLIACDIYQWHKKQEERRRGMELHETNE